MTKYLSKSEIKQIVRAEIDSLMSEFENFPTDFQSEADIQSYLFSNLRKALPKMIDVHYEGEPNSVKENIVHCEVNTKKRYKGRSKRYDIAIYNPEKMNDADAAPMIAIEIKYDSNRMLNNDAGVHKDLRKLIAKRNELEVGYMIILNTYQPNGKVIEKIKKLREHFLNNSRYQGKPKLYLNLKHRVVNPSESFISVIEER